MIAGTILLAYGNYKLVSSPKVNGLSGKLLDRFDTSKIDIDKIIAESGPEIIKKR